jgi:hypothetical protein
MTPELIKTHIKGKGHQIIDSSISTFMIASKDHDMWVREHVDTWIGSSTFPMLNWSNSQTKIQPGTVAAAVVVAASTSHFPIPTTMLFP